MQGLFPSRVYGSEALGVPSPSLEEAWSPLRMRRSPGSLPLPLWEGEGGPSPCPGPDGLVGTVFLGMMGNS